MNNQPFRIMGALAEANVEVELLTPFELKVYSSASYNSSAASS